MKSWAWFYKTPAWRKTRAAYLRSQHGVCERCGKPARVVHHKVYLTASNINDPNYTLSWSNLEALCQDCHNNEHHATSQCGEGLMFDENGMLIESNTPPCETCFTMSGRNDAES